MMISERMRNRVQNLRDAADTGSLTSTVLNLALAGFEADAETVARMESVVAPQPIRAGNLLGFLGFQTPMRRRARP